MSTDLTDGSAEPRPGITHRDWPDGPLPRVERDDEYQNPMFFHSCNGVVRRTFLPLSRERGWRWTDEGDLMPSVHCTTCGTHGWWTSFEGWQPV